MFQVRLKDISSNFKEFEGYLKEVKQVSGKFQWCFNAISRPFKEVSRGFKENVKGISRIFQGCYKEN